MEIELNELNLQIEARNKNKPANEFLLPKLKLEIQSLIQPSGFLAPKHQARSWS